MKLILALVIAFAASACNRPDGDGSDIDPNNISCGTNLPPDMAQSCPTEIAEGDVCNAECPYQVVPGCGCGANGIWHCDDVDGGR